MSSSRSKHFLLFLFLAVILVPVWLFFVWHRAMHRPLLTRGKATSVIVQPGSTIHDLADQLDRRGLITHPGVFVFDARISGDAKRLRYGEYRILPGMSASQLLSNIISGKGVVKYQITFVEGWTFRDIKNMLREDNHIRHLFKDKNNKEIMSMLTHPQQHPEGRFFPDTYTYTWGNSDLEILQHAYQRMQAFLFEQWGQRANDLLYKDAYQALIVASLIEKETSVSNERPIIAGVILNRIKKGMRLQVDPTVLYGLEKPYGTVITKEDLHSKTLYNTYQVFGLPPTPIGMPSGASIIAALHPINTPYLYYVARGDGSHVFSATYRQHLKAVRRYRESQQEPSGYLFCPFKTPRKNCIDPRYEFIKIMNYILRA